jgi:hypothetical protein
LLKTSIEEQKDVCHRSKAWECVMTHSMLLISSAISTAYNARKSINATDRLPHQDEPVEHHASWYLHKPSPYTMAIRREDADFSRSLFHYCITVWGIFELWGVSCVDKLCNELLYSVLQLYVMLDFFVVAVFIYTTISTLLSSL